MKRIALALMVLATVAVIGARVAFGAAKPIGSRRRKDSRAMGSPLAPMR